MGGTSAVLDIRDGLARVGGMEDLYVELLERFREELPRGLAELDALTPPDRIRRVHSVRGVAGTVGARALFEAATVLERALRQEAATAAHPEASAAFAQALTVTVAAIAEHLNVAQHAALSGGGAEDGAASVEAMRGLLASGDPAATDLLAAERTAWRSLLGVRFEAFAAAIDGFDFDAALGILGKE